MALILGVKAFQCLRQVRELSDRVWLISVPFNDTFVLMEDFTGMYRSFLTLFILASVMFGFSSRLLAGEAIPISQLPEPVVNAVKTRFPNAQFLSAEREIDDGRVKYEVKILDGNQKKEVELTPNGQVLKVENED
jgi:hypothetical protein